MISKTLSTSEKRAALHTCVPDLAEFCQQLYPLLVAHSDDFGRLQGDVFTVKHAIDPTSPRPLPDFERALQALHDVALIVWYVGEGNRRVIQITQFEPHQTGLHKRTASKFPDVSGRFPEIPSEQKGTEQKGTEQKKDVSSATPSVAEPPSPVLVTFPTVGKGPRTWDFTEAYRADLQEAYPAIDVLAEVRVARRWVDANQPKTAAGMKKFLVSWMNRAVQRGGQVRPQPAMRPRGEAPHVEWTCHHVDRCAHPRMCAMKDAMPHKYPKRTAVSA